MFDQNVRLLHQVVKLREFKAYDLTFLVFLRVVRNSGVHRGHAVLVKHLLMGAFKGLNYFALKLLKPLMYDCELIIL